MSQIGKYRLVLLRVFYFIVGVSFVFLAGFDFNYDQIGFVKNIIKSGFFAVALLALIGVFQPLKMLPLLFFSAFWKCILLIAFVMPSYFSGELDDNLKNTLLPISTGLLMTLIVIPWKYALSNFFTFKVDN